MSNPQASPFDLCNKVFLSMARRIASLNPPAQSSGSCRILKRHPSTCVTKFLLSVARRIASLNPPARSAGSCRILDRHASICGRKFFFCRSEATFLATDTKNFLSKFSSDDRGSDRPSAERTESRATCRILDRHASTCGRKFFFCRWQGRSLCSTPLRGAQGHVGSSIVTPQLVEDSFFFVGGKEGRFAPLSCAPRRVMSDPRSSLLDLCNKVFFVGGKEDRFVSLPCAERRVMSDPRSSLLDLWKKIVYIGKEGRFAPLSCAPRRFMSDPRSSLLDLWKKILYIGKEGRFAPLSCAPRRFMSDPRSSLLDLWKKILYVGKEGLFSPLPCAPRRFMSDPRSSRLNLWKTVFFCRWQGRALRSTPLRSAQVYVGYSVVTPRLV